MTNGRTRRPFRHFQQCRHCFRPLPPPSYCSSSSDRQLIWSFQSSSKVSDCFPLKKRKQTNCFAYFLMVPLSMASTTFFFGVGAELSNLRILEIFKCTRPNSPNGFTAHMKLVCDDRYSPACKSSILTMTLQLPKKTRNDSILVDCQ